ncbi:MAG TPA: efflux RND transporter periplasmic adaptor subunit [Gemmatimonadales bacterium]|nr:efflux RND transporter periplasmic adaptor subunit [Gemmatimonadales bacterium]
MSRRMKLGLFAGLLVVAVGAIVALGAAKGKNKPVEVRMEKVGTRDLVAVVTASGRIEPDTKVDVLSDIQGRITKIGVKEGDLVRKGDFLLQIDPAIYQAAVGRAEALLASSQSDLVRARANEDQAKRALDRAKELQKTNSSLITQESVEQVETAYEVAKANTKASQATVDQARAGLQEARDNLSKTRIVAPISGRITRLAVEEGEVAVPGTFSRDVGLLMTVADLSVILAKVQVDETDVVRLSDGDSVQVSIDAFPDTSFVGRVTKISNSAKLTAGTNTASNDRAVDFDVEITLSNPPKDIRPDLSATARIVTDVRKGALAVPIIALTVRSHQAVPNETKPEPATADSGKGGPKAKEREGVFVVTDGVAHFRPVKVGIAGDEYFEVIEGVKAGETIVAGTYQAIRDLQDSARVKEMVVDTAAKRKKS